MESTLNKYTDTLHDCVELHVRCPLLQPHTVKKMKGRAVQLLKGLRTDYQ